MLDFNFHFTTERLTISYLNPSNEKHVDFIHELHNSPEVLHVHRNMPVDRDTRESARKFIEQGVAGLEKIGYGRFLISRRHIDGTNGDDKPQFSDSINDHELIGVLSMRVARFPSSPSVPDVGFGIMAKYYGNGYATEAAQGLIKYYQEEKGQTAFAGYTEDGNERSMKMFQRLGFDARGLKEVVGIIGNDVWLKCQVYTKGVEGEINGMRDVGE